MRGWVSPEPSILRVGTTRAKHGVSILIGRLRSRDFYGCHIDSIDSIEDGSL